MFTLSDPSVLSFGSNEQYDVNVVKIQSQEICKPFKKHLDFCIDFL